MLITGTTLEDNYLAWIAFDTNATVPTFEFTTLHFRVAGGVAKILCDEGLYKNANIKPFSALTRVKQHILVPTPTLQKLLVLQVLLNNC